MKIKELLDRYNLKSRQSIYEWRNIENIYKALDSYCD
jgi:hypothetical protein